MQKGFQDAKRAEKGACRLHPETKTAGSGKKCRANRDMPNVFYLRTMLGKAKIKYIRSLHLNKFRRKYGLFLAEGTVNVLDFLSGPLQVKEIYATENWLDRHKEALVGKKPETVNPGEMEKISALKKPPGVLAVINMPVYRLPQIISRDNYVLALDDIRDPGNLGTIIRTADWFGIKDVVCSQNTVDAYNPKVVQATMGSLGRVRVHYTDLAEWLSGKPDSLTVFGTMLQGNDVRKVEKPGKGILLIGSEAHGISKALHPFIDKPVRIPSAPGSGAESLNAAVAAAIACFVFCNLKG